MKYAAVMVCLVVGTVLLFWGFDVAQTHTLTGFSMSMIGIGLWGVGISILKP